MQLRETVPEDFVYCKMNSISNGRYEPEDGNIDYSATLEEDGRVLAIGGIVRITEATAWAYLELTRFALDYIYSVYRTIKEWTDGLCKKLKIVRLQAWADCGKEESILMLEHLGFEQEFLMRDFVERGRPAYMFVKYYYE